MGRTLPSAAQVFQMAEQELAGFRGGLSRADQRALDELFDSAHRHVAEAAYAAHPLPMEIFLLAMLVEQHKELLRLKARLEQLLGQPLDPEPRDPRKLFS
jgi:hypothetical protein